MTFTVMHDICLVKTLHSVRAARSLLHYLDVPSRSTCWGLKISCFLSEARCIDVYLLLAHYFQCSSVTRGSFVLDAKFVTYLTSSARRCELRSKHGPALTYRAFLLFQMDAIDDFRSTQPLASNKLSPHAIYSITGLKPAHAADHSLQLHLVRRRPAKAFALFLPPVCHYYYYS